MLKVNEGMLAAGGSHFAIVVSRFNELITSKLLAGALDCLKRHGCGEEDIEVAWVPGAFELPLMARDLAATGRYAAVAAVSNASSGRPAH